MTDVLILFPIRVFDTDLEEGIELASEMMEQMKQSVEIAAEFHDLSEEDIAGCMKLLDATVVELD